MYQSPIEIITKQMRTQFEDNVFKAIQDYGIVVDKEELLKALQYDRGQYEKGFADGMLVSKDEWISVEERVPECERGAESKAVLFITKQGFMYTGYYGCGGIFHDRYFREFKNATEGYDISNVTHWMPLPEPPKKGGGE